MSDRGSRPVILGTAGHIDHGKTALVRALTGTDTDRLKEEKARGITIELGFAELTDDRGQRFGVVDVPGHEAFVRAMVAGAAGMDLVLLVVAADEGVMPQTREHLAIVELLGVRELVVALSKVDLVDAEWLDLVSSDVSEALSKSPYANAPMVPTSVQDGTGLDELRVALGAAAERSAAKARDDVARLPLDRVFSIQGTGTVVTGTLWSGSIRKGDRVRVLPGDAAARVRSVEVHGASVDAAFAGERTALALTGEGSDRDAVSRGATLVTDDAWHPSQMLTARVQLLADTAWTLAHNQRVHLHVGTSEVLARCALLEAAPLQPGESGWVQLRLEQPVVARGLDRFVVRAYSPVTTIGGGVVAESQPPKRNRIDPSERALLERMVGPDDADAVAARLQLLAWAGAPIATLPVATGLAPAALSSAVDVVVAGGAIRSARWIFCAQIREAAERRVLEAVDEGHASGPLRPVIPLTELRGTFPRWAPPELADAVISGLIGGGLLEAGEGGVRRPGYRPTLSREQESALVELERIVLESGLSPPGVEEFPDRLRTRDDIWALMRRLEEAGVVQQVADGLFVGRDELERAAERIRVELGGRTGLGPSDFRDVIPVTRKHLIPLLNYFDGQGTTIRSGAGRDVPGEG